MWPHGKIKVRVLQENNKYELYSQFQIFDDRNDSLFHIS